MQESPKRYMLKMLLYLKIRTFKLRIQLVSSKILMTNYFDIYK